MGGVLTTMTRAMGPAKLQINLSWIEIQQKSGFPQPSGSKPTAKPDRKEEEDDQQRNIYFPQLWSLP